MSIKLKDIKVLFWNASLINYRLTHLVDGNSDSLLWASSSFNDRADIGGGVYDEYYVHEIQTNIANTLDIVISRNAGIMGDESN
ncbi:MAG: hypothetical protein BWY97_01387 [Tenericutes bacterium ADurb.BinA124]|nr:MAG: hypothetical protein BWY97_01387 [Tenericutes bacterium ADurb.BinA124]